MPAHRSEFTLGGPQSCEGEGKPFSLRSERTELLFLAAFSLALYIMTTGFGLVVDDLALILQNPYIRSFHYLREIFTQGFWSFLGPEGQLNYYRPLVTLTLLAERTVFDVRFGGFHLVNVILHALVVCLVYLLARRLFPEGRAPLWAALLFAAHPVHTENVAPVSGISDLECAFFFLWAALVYMRPLDSRGRWPRRWGWVTAGLFFLAVLTKEVALLLAPLLVLYEHSLRRDPGGMWRERFSRYAPTLLCSALYLLIRSLVVGGVGGLAARRELALGPTILSGFSLLGEYVYKLLWPQHLSYYEMHKIPRSVLDPLVILGVGVCLIAVTNILRCWRRDRRIAFAICWFFVTLAPVLNVRWLPDWAFGERFLYIPSVAFCWLLGLAIEWASRREVGSPIRSRLVMAVPVALVVLASARTLWRLPEWKDQVALSQATLRESPDAAIYYIYLGNAYRMQGFNNAARPAYVTAMALDPTLSEAYVDLAGVLMEEGSVEGARALLRGAVTVRPNYPQAFFAWGVFELGRGNRALARQMFQRALILMPDYPEALISLGRLLLEEGARLEEAQSLLERAVRSDPQNADGHINLGSVYARQGRGAQAEKEFRVAMVLAPGNESPYLNLAGLYEEKENMAAIDAYRSAIRLFPNSANAHFRIGVLCLKIGNNSEALKELTRTVEIQPASSLAHAQLGRAYLASGNPSAAKREFEITLRLDPNDSLAKAGLAGQR